MPSRPIIASLISFVKHHANLPVVGVVAFGPEIGHELSGVIELVLGDVAEMLAERALLGPICAVPLRHAHILSEICLAECVEMSEGARSDISQRLLETVKIRRVSNDRSDIFDNQGLAG